MEQQHLLRSIPKVDELLSEASGGAWEALSPAAVRDGVRGALDALREGILSGALSALPGREAILEDALARAGAAELPSLRRVINGTGVVLHTNLGRSCLSARASAAVAEVARHYSTLEYDVESGSRGSRHDHIDGLLASVTGAEAAMVVNNNAAAVLLILSAMGRGGEVVASRGELVEIGGSFRIPDIMTQCGCALREVGTTNKTHLFDYENAIGPETRALLRVHTSNFRIVGFCERPGLAELVELGRKHGLPVIEDLGSGSLVDLAAFGIHDEPTVQQSVRAGVDVISFSGDKEYIEKLKKHPLARALRVDKMTIAALRETLWAYRDGERAREQVPVLAMLGAPEDALRARAEKLRLALAEAGAQAQTVPAEGQVGGGSCPTQLVRSWAVAVDPGALTVDALAEKLRRSPLPIIGRISQGQYLLDVRTLLEEDVDDICRAVKEAVS